MSDTERQLLQQWNCVVMLDWSGYTTLCWTLLSLTISEADSGDLQAGWDLQEGLTCMNKLLWTRRAPPGELLAQHEGGGVLAELLCCQSTAT